MFLYSSSFSLFVSFSKYSSHVSFIVLYTTPFCLVARVKFTRHLPNSSELTSLVFSKARERKHPPHTLWFLRNSVPQHSSPHPNLLSTRLSALKNFISYLFARLVNRSRILLFYCSLYSLSPPSIHPFFLKSEIMSNPKTSPIFE